MLEPGTGRRTIVEVGPAQQILRRGRGVVRWDDAGTEILLVTTRRGLLAVENRCPHLGARLDDGAIRRGGITCASHGYRFDLTTGRCTRGAGLSRRPLRTFQAWVVDGEVLVEGPEPATSDHLRLVDASPSAAD